MRRTALGWTRPTWQRLSGSLSGSWTGGVVRSESENTTCSAGTFPVTTPGSERLQTAEAKAASPMRSGHGLGNPGLHPAHAGPGQCRPVWGMGWTCNGHRPPAGRGRSRAAFCFWEPQRGFSTVTSQPKLFLPLRCFCVSGTSKVTPGHSPQGSFPP